MKSRKLKWYSQRYVASLSNLNPIFKVNWSLDCTLAYFPLGYLLRNGCFAHSTLHSPLGRKWAHCSHRMHITIIIISQLLPLFVEHSIWIKRITPLSFQNILKYRCVSFYFTIRKLITEGKWCVYDQTTNVKRIHYLKPCLPHSNVYDMIIKQHCPSCGSGK